MNRFLMIFFMLPMLAVLSCSGGDTTPGGSGLIEATEVTVSSAAAGRIAQLDFDEGDRIKPGDTIVLIDTVTLTLRLSQTEALKQSA
ncbi:MAG: biotin/lipoyl-binding protein, partial [candidate division Zixibacteria bacterium]|nr:biotin/lipoyl-binding protein [candidate division Zixibacteria bacterium]